MKEQIQKAIEVLRSGGIILYPTDTVWGIGCDATDPEAVAKVYAIKNREDSKSLVLLASDIDMICRYVKEIPEMAVQLIEVNDKPMTIIYPGAVVGSAPAVISSETISRVEKSPHWPGNWKHYPKLIKLWISMYASSADTSTTPQKETRNQA